MVFHRSLDAQRRVCVGSLMCRLCCCHVLDQVGQMFREYSDRATAQYMLPTPEAESCAMQALAIVVGVAL